MWFVQWLNLLIETVSGDADARYRRPGDEVLIPLEERTAVRLAAVPVSGR